MGEERKDLAADGNVQRAPRAIRVFVTKETLPLRDCACKVFAERFSDSTDGVAAPTILELGCSTGECTLQLYRRGFRRIVGVDVGIACVEDFADLEKESGLSRDAFSALIVDIGGNRCVLML